MHSIFDYIVSPINAIYIKNKPIFPFFKPIILGDIEINISVKDNDSSINKIELFINNKLVHSNNNSFLFYPWNESKYGKQIISIVSMDSKGNQACIEQVVWKFF